MSNVPTRPLDAAVQALHALLSQRPLVGQIADYPEIYFEFIAKLERAANDIRDNLSHASPPARHICEEEVESLRAALKPFAALGDDGWGSALPSDTVLAVWWADKSGDPHCRKRPHITQGDIRAARAALQRDAQGGGT